MLIEILVSALVLVIVAGAVFTLLSATARSSTEERHRSEAYSLAQEDQSRLRGMRISELSRLPATPRKITLNGTPFEVLSTGVFVNDKTATTSCSQATSSADYLRVASTVTWPSMGGRPPVVIESIVSPSNGSLDPSHGTLSFTVTKADGTTPIPGVTLTSAGFSGTTDTAGCVSFPDQAAGNYTVTPSGAVTGLVDKDGKAPAAMTAGVSAEVTTLVSLMYDVPGKIEKVSFTTKSSSGTIVPSSADSIVVSNVQMTEAKVFGTPGGVRETKFEPGSLFPFSKPDAVYAGACGGNNPNPNGESNPPGALAMASVTIPPNGTAPAVTLQLPALYLNVWKGTSSTPETLVATPHVIVSDENCKIGSNMVKRTVATEGGHLKDPGLPWSVYDVCVDNGTRRKTTTAIPVQSLTSGTTLDVYMGSGTQSGVCS